MGKRAVQFTVTITKTYNFDGKVDIPPGTVKKGDDEALQEWIEENFPDLREKGIFEDLDEQDETVEFEEVQFS